MYTAFNYNRMELMLESNVSINLIASKDGNVDRLDVSKFFVEIPQQPKFGIFSKIFNWFKWLLGYGE